MAFNLEMQSILKKLNWLGFALVLPFQGIGCVSIQRSSPSGLRPVTNCSDFSNGVLDSEELYQLMINVKSCSHGIAISILSTFSPPKSLDGRAIASNDR